MSVGIEPGGIEDLQIKREDTRVVASSQSVAAKHHGQSSTICKDGNFINYFLQRELIAVITVDSMQTGRPAGCVIRLLKKLKLQSRVHRQMIPSARVM